MTHAEFHPEADELTLVALGEPPEPSVADHVRTCAVCSVEVAELRTAVGVARSTSPDAVDRSIAPSPAVWARIADELDLPRVGTEAAPQRPPARAAGAPRHRRVTKPPVDQSDGRGRSGPGWWRYAAVAAAAALVAVGATVGITRPWATPPTAVASVSTVAEASLRPIGTVTDATGAVRVVRRDGQVQVVVSTSGLPLSSGYYEAWLFDPSHPDRMQSLGALGSGKTTTFPLPAGFDLTTFSAVDISAETFDGDPAHSAISVLRGTLTR